MVSLYPAKCRQLGLRVIVHTNYTANIIQTLSTSGEQKQSHTIILPVNKSAIDGRLDFESSFPSL